MEELDRAVTQAMKVNRVAVVDVQVDPSEYLSHTKPCAL
jgi:thiamine pyrophosphate-dependent acetolactate synthase large subunit-like protein